MTGRCFIGDRTVFIRGLFLEVPRGLSAGFRLDFKGFPVPEARIKVVDFSVLNVRISARCFGQLVLSEVPPRTQPQRGLLSLVGKKTSLLTRPLVGADGQVPVCAPLAERSKAGQCPGLRGGSEFCKVRLDRCPA